MYTKYQIWVAGDNDMEKYGLPFKTESEAIVVATGWKEFIANKELITENKVYDLRYIF